MELDARIRLRSLEKSIRRGSHLDDLFRILNTSRETGKTMTNTNSERHNFDFGSNRDAMSRGRHVHTPESGHQCCQCGWICEWHSDIYSGKGHDDCARQWKEHCEQMNDVPWPQQGIESFPDGDEPPEDEKKEGKEHVMSETPKQQWPALNTDRELWRERPDDYYADSLHVTEGGGIGINCGGHVIVQPIREWHRLANAEIERMKEPASQPSEPSKDVGLVGNPAVPSQADGTSEGLRERIDVALEGIPYPAHTTVLEKIVVLFQTELSPLRELVEKWRGTGSPQNYQEWLDQHRAEELSTALDRMGS